MKEARALCVRARVWLCIIACAGVIESLCGCVHLSVQECVLQCVRVSIFMKEVRVGCMHLPAGACHLRARQPQADLLREQSAPRAHA